MITANQLNGRAIGSLFFSGFGAIWITLALYVKQMLSAELAVAIGAVFAALLLSALWLFRQAKHFPKVPEDPARSREFHRVNGAQWIVIFIVATIFARLHIDAYVLSAITAIVGIHLFPLAKLFRYPLHYVTGAALVLWASASVLTVPADHLQGATAIGTGIILWISSATTLAIAATLAKRGEQITEPGQDGVRA